MEKLDQDYAALATCTLHNRKFLLHDESPLRLHGLAQPLREMTPNLYLTSFLPRKRMMTIGSVSSLKGDGFNFPPFCLSGGVTDLPFTLSRGDIVP
ncbi:hypothetical protein HAX54_004164 [Datura stramonium]|uniref:Uncharacterized protein n=1 Tax=Datura stramonium TaxID=4076 RepID=A0ABS8RTM2_DATST|nr:hypothetical protein [Datura stramonium]